MTLHRQDKRVAIVIECARCGRESESYARPGRCVDERCDGGMVQRRYIRESEHTKLREAVALHARTLDDAALGVPDCVNRDDVDNELYNAARRLDPEWWDEQVPGLARTRP